MWHTGMNDSLIWHELFDKDFIPVNVRVQDLFFRVHDSEFLIAGTESALNTVLASDTDSTVR